MSQMVVASYGSSHSEHSYVISHYFVILSNCSFGEFPVLFYNHLLVLEPETWDFVLFLFSSITSLLFCAWRTIDQWVDGHCYYQCTAALFVTLNYSLLSFTLLESRHDKTAGRGRGRGRVCVRVRFKWVAG